MTFLDDYRRDYDNLDFAGHQAFYERVGAEYPEQSWWNADACAAFLAHYQPETVDEIGGWDGGLAAAVLPGSSVLGWRNFEITDVPQVCSHRAYTFELPDDWAWSQPRKADALVLSQVIEHMSEEHVHAMFSAFDVRAIYVDTPLHPFARSDWNGSTTGHILTLSLEELDRIAAGYGYRLEHSGTDNRHGFTSYWRWYATTP